MHGPRHIHEEHQVRDRPFPRHRPRLERSWRDATASLNLARVAYARKDYATALGHLQRSDYKDTINNLTAKTLQMKIYYETDEHDLLATPLSLGPVTAKVPDGPGLGVELDEAALARFRQG